MKPKPSSAQRRGRSRLASRSRATRPPLGLGVSSLDSEQRIARRWSLQAREGPRDAETAGEDPQQEVVGVYIISVAARILEMHPQTLRKYERLGLVRPSRTVGMLRLYSEEDIEKLRLIKYLEENLGLNLAGVEFALHLLNHLFDMHQRLRKMTEAERFLRVVEQEMTQLLERLNLPLQGEAREGER